MMHWEGVKYKAKVMINFKNSCIAKIHLCKIMCECVGMCDELYRCRESYEGTATGMLVVLYQGGWDSKDGG